MLTLPSSSMCRIICSTCDSGEFLLSGYGMLSSYVQNNQRKINLLELQIVGNKSKGQFSKRVFQENKTRQIFRRTNMAYPLIHVRTCAYQEVKYVCFSENLMYFVFLKHPF